MHLHLMRAVRCPHFMDISYNKPTKVAPNSEVEEKEDMVYKTVSDEECERCQVNLHTST